MSSIKLITQQVKEEVIAGISNSSTIYILISFAIKVGASLINPYLLGAVKRGAGI
ncbi:hypothetical protein [Gracilibacillus thailandensis]|uniref:Uncharacterized protein n=1 Tax=Gracilibacillus thailandensis TaxID=563735 RepID=A0A6N7QYN9_9BACI|nr:hypothetical protein [Gracilibacillus thailandensis]MRI66614.1 hypothetical protein [Gracilibacillus thailandensis]